MACVIISRGGKGAAWLHENLEAARLHPLTQYGDAEISCAEDVFREYGLYEVPYLLQVADSPLAVEVEKFRLDRVHLPARQQLEQLAEKYADQLWQRLQRVARPAPDDPRTICNLVREDRIEEKKMAKQKTEAAATAPKAKTAAAPKNGAKKAEAAATAAAPKKVAGFSLGAKITFGKNEEGKPYGKDNNPKRAGSAAAETFGLYRNGMTIQQALDAGIGASDIGFNAGRGFITVAE